jgi:hypothetical protein
MNSAPNKRRFRRRFCSLPIELRSLWASYGVRGTTSDISGVGCYVRLDSVFQVGTIVDVALWMGETKLAFQGRVRSADGVGNGIEFTKITDEQRTCLCCYLDELKGPRPLPAVIFR